MCTAATFLTGDSLTHSRGRVNLMDAMKMSGMHSVRISNLGWHFLPSKVALRSPYLSCLWTDLATILVDFWPRRKWKVYTISDKSIHRELRKGVSDATFEGKKRQPKFQIRTLDKTDPVDLLSDRIKWGTLISFVPRKFTLHAAWPKWTS